MSLKIELKTLLPYIVLIATVGMTWGIWSEKLEALESKTDIVSEMQVDIAIIKEKIMWIEAYLINDGK
tara:strand:+ start:179 stop:382 length:204 start_codon:yes stop_codon:yes gene_type:complete